MIVLSRSKNARRPSAATHADSLVPSLRGAYRLLTSVLTDPYGSRTLPLGSFRPPRFPLPFHPLDARTAGKERPRCSCLWSPKGGSGTSVLAAACALVLAGAASRSALVDLDGDQPAMFGLGAEPATGLARLARRRAGGAHRRARSARRRGRRRRRAAPARHAGRGVLAPVPAAEAGAALGGRVARRSVPTVVDLRPAPTAGGASRARGRRRVARRRPRLLPRARGAPSARAALAPRRASCVSRSRARSSGRRDVAEVLGRPVLAEVPVRAADRARRRRRGAAARLPDRWPGPRSSARPARPARGPAAGGPHDGGTARIDRPMSSRRVHGRRRRTQQRVHRRLVAAGGLDRSTTRQHDRAGRSLAAAPARRAAARRGAAADARSVDVCSTTCATRSRPRARSSRCSPTRVSEIMVNGPGRAYVERAGRLEAVDCDLDAAGDRAPRRTGRRAARAAPRSRVADGRRPARRRVAAARRDPAARARRAVRHHPPLRRPRASRSTRSASTGARGAFLRWTGRGRDGTSLVSGGTSAGKTTLLQRARRRRSPPANASSRSRRPPSCGSRSRTSCGSRRGRPTPRARAR